ncbi:MAG: M1 family metallopeptidase, partial [Flavobacteriales bacterium]
MKKVLVILFLLPLYIQAQFTLADTLRGSLRPERTCFDVHYYHLNIAVDTANQSISGYNEIHFSAVDDVDRIQLDLYANMTIDSIVFRKFHLDYKRTFNAVFIDFPGTILKGYQEKIRVYYHGSPQVAKRAPWDGGFVWTQDKNARLWMGVACEGAGASLWWPNKDHLSDEPDSMRITCAVPNGLQCIANGNLEWQHQNTFQWKVSYPINNYNVTLNIGDYVHFREYYVSGNDSMPCDYYVLPYNLEKAKVQFKQVKPMLKIYEDLYGRYPFWNDGYALVETPYLGMEHQGAIAYGNRYLPGYRGQVDSNLHQQGIDFDYIIIHETAHEYWGNSVTVQDIADLWIHEGFATYTEALYVEKMHGHQAYMDYMQFLKQGIDNDASIIGTYGVNSEGSGDMYPKGAWMLHTIRNVVNNDSLFFACLKG